MADSEEQQLRAACEGADRRAFWARIIAAGFTMLDVTLSALTQLTLAIIVVGLAIGLFIGLDIYYSHKASKGRKQLDATGRQKVDELKGETGKLKSESEQLKADLDATRGLLGIHNQNAGIT